MTSNSSLYIFINFFITFFFIFFFAFFDYYANQQASTTVISLTRSQRLHISHTLLSLSHITHIFAPVSTPSNTHTSSYYNIVSRYFHLTVLLWLCLMLLMLQFSLSVINVITAFAVLFIIVDVVFIYCCWQCCRVGDLKSFFGSFTPFLPPLPPPFLFPPLPFHPLSLLLAVPPIHFPFISNSSLSTSFSPLIHFLLYPQLLFPLHFFHFLYHIFLSSPPISSTYMPTHLFSTSSSSFAFFLFHRILHFCSLLSLPIH